MTEERRRILNMLATGKITAQEAEALLDAVPGSSAAPSEAASHSKPAPKYLRVLAEGNDGHQSGKVNVRVPINLIRAGVRLAALLPSGVYDQINRALKQNGLDFDVSKVKPENLEELVQHLSDLSVDVEGGNGEKVRVFCE